MTTKVLACLFVLAIAPVAFAQDVPRSDATSTVMSPGVVPTGAPVPQRAYRIGPDDLLTISVLQASELDQSVRVSAHGDVSIRLIGSVPAVGLTTQELERDIEARFREKYIRDPDVSVLVTEVHSRGVSVVGSVKRPGILQVNGTTSLLELISLAGGLAEDAGDSVVILRGRSDGSATSTGPSGATPEAIEVDLKALMESRDPRANIAIQTGDVVNVRAAALVYVVGAVKKPGAFAVRGNDQLTVLRAVALGEGLLPVAARGEAMVVRTDARGGRVEMPVDLEAVLRGRSPDLQLQAQDVLFVPTSGAKVATRATLEFLSRAFTLRGLFF